jgi:biopolymer transport protein ExbB/TolQ
MSGTSVAEDREPLLDWARCDIEQRLMFPGGRYTRVNNLLSGIIGAIATAVFFGLLQIPGLAGSGFAAIFTERGPTQHAVMFLFFWSLAILGIKWLKLRFQWRALDVRVIPNEPGFVLSTATVNRVLDHIHDRVDDPRHFVLFNRIVVALANLRNLGHVGDVDDILRSQAAQDESAMETSYALVQGFVWAIPVLGFIGTVLGLSGAIGQFSGVLGDAGDIGQITSALKGVTGGLATAFDTTLVALVAALIVQLLMTVLKKAEEEFLDAAMEFGIRNVVGRLRIAEQA